MSQNSGFLLNANRKAKYKSRTENILVVIGTSENDGKLKH